jgi:GT2 family glycosyltransferase
MVRAVVVNFNGGDLTLDCLRHLRATDWPRDQLEIVLVDNASSDGVVARVREELPDIRVIESPTNRGFAGGCNLALHDLEGIDHVALVNSDVLVESGWLGPLVATLEHNRRLGAACPKILFAFPFVDVELQAPTDRPGRGDRRWLGVRVSGARVREQDVWRDVQLWNGFWGPEHGSGEDRTFQWSKGRAVLRVPVPADDPPEEFELRMASDEPKRVTLSAGRRHVEQRVSHTPAWYRAPLDGAPFDVINNVGCVLAGDGYGADRGYLDRDEGQYSRSEDVFAWCGAAVLLRADYLADVGLFDERLFLYYEDLELAWRGRERGWRYRYVPDSVVRHVHTASTVAGSEMFDYFNERNRLLTLTRHAPTPLLARALVRYLLVTASYARRDVASPLLRGRRPQPSIVIRRLRALAGYARRAPPMFRNRREARGSHQL